jgi:hypothetical protein
MKEIKNFQFCLFSEIIDIFRLKYIFIIINYSLLNIKHSIIVLNLLKYYLL